MSRADALIATLRSAQRTANLTNAEMVGVRLRLRDLEQRYSREIEIVGVAQSALFHFAVADEEKPSDAEIS